MWASKAGAKARTFGTKKAKKGEDRGKPSLRRTIREDVPDAHKAEKQVRRDEVDVQTKNKGLNLTMKVGEETVKSKLVFTGGSFKNRNIGEEGEENNDSKNKDKHQDFKPNN